jgi:hypothetical protein
VPVGGAPGVIVQGGAVLLRPRIDGRERDPLAQQGAEVAVVILVVRGVGGEGSNACVGRWSGT